MGVLMSTFVDTEESGHKSCSNHGKNLNAPEADGGFSVHWAGVSILPSSSLLGREEGYIGKA